MAVTTFDVTSTTVDRAVSWMDIGASTDPNTTRVDSMIDQFASDLCLALQAASITPADIATDSALFGSCQGHLVRRVACEVILSNTRTDSDFTLQAREDWNLWLGRIQAREFSSLGTESPPGSTVKGVFDSQTTITRRASRAPRLGFWRKGRGFN